MIARLKICFLLFFRAAVVGALATQNVATICDNLTLGASHTPRSVSPVSTPEDMPAAPYLDSNGTHGAQPSGLGGIPTLGTEGLPTSLSENFSIVHNVEVSEHYYEDF